MRIITILFFLILGTACREKQERKAENLPTVGQVEEAILKVNKYILKRNRDHINGFIRRTGWEMNQTGSGLRYKINADGRGKTVSSGDFIRLEYNLMLIDGTFVSSSEKDGMLEFTVGQGGVETGLEEAVLLIREGAKATLILPPHLAFGNFGDPEKKIPPDAILIYEISLKNVR